MSSVQPDTLGKPWAVSTHRGGLLGGQARRSWVGRIFQTENFKTGEWILLLPDYHLKETLRDSAKFDLCQEKRKKRKEEKKSSTDFVT